MGGEEAAKILSFARDQGVVTSADILAPGDQAGSILDWIAPAFEHLDYLLPNDDQVLRPDRRDRPDRRVPRPGRARVSCVAATSRRRRSAGRRPPTRRWSRPTRSMSSTPRAAATRSRPGSCAACRSDARRAEARRARLRRRRARGRRPGLGPRRFRPARADEFAADAPDDPHDQEPRHKMTADRNATKPDQSPAVRRRDDRHRSRGGGSGFSAGRQPSASEAQADTRAASTTPRPTSSWSAPGSPA